MMTESSSRRIQLIFEVPEGLEFVASKDINESLDETIIQNGNYMYEAKSGRVHLFCTIDNIDLFKSYIQNVQLLCIYSVTLIASESVIPNEIFAELQPTYDFITQQTKETPWYDFIQEDPNDASTTVSFRATFRKGSVKHKAPSQEIAGYVGFAFSDFFKHWKVKMTEFTYEIDSFWFKTANQDLLYHLNQTINQQVDSQTVVLSLGVKIPLQIQSQRNRVFVGRTSLNPAIAYCLALLSDPKPGQIILDMCCGTGTIPIEGASKFRDVFWLGSEIRDSTLTEKAHGNVKHCNLKNVDLMLGDSRKLCFREGCIDSIVSDWPWGLRENSFTQIQGLYPKFMKQMYRILKVNGKAYIVTQGRKLLNRVLAYDWCKKQWDLEQVIPIGIGGYDVYLYILTKH